MKTIHRIIASVVLGGGALTAGTPALAQDRDECRGGYRIMLMTPTECNAYLQQLKDVRARSDRLAELDLEEWHASLLIQRAEACPCRAGEPVTLFRRTAEIPQKGKIQTY
jgi:hypothetical protein